MPLASDDGGRVGGYIESPGTASLLFGSNGLGALKSLDTDVFVSTSEPKMELKLSLKARTICDAPRQSHHKRN